MGVDVDHEPVVEVGGLLEVVAGVEDAAALPQGQQLEVQGVSRRGSRESLVRLVGWAGWAVNPFLRGLPEELHLAAGGGVVGLGILMNHAEDQGGRARVHARYSEVGPQRYDGSAVVVSDTNNKGTPSGTQAISRALAVLRLLAESDGELSASAVATRLRLTSGTTNRILRVLMAEGLVAQSVRRETYYLGSAAILLGQAAQHGFGLDRTLPILERVNADTGESVNLVVRDGGESVVMLRVQSTLALRFEQRPGARFPLYTTASGKAILAFSDDADEYLNSLPREMRKLTPHTLGTPAELALQLKETQERGYSIDEQENVDGVRCVGAPILDSYGHAQAALVIQVPTVRMPPERVKTLGELVVQVSMEIARMVPIDRRLSH